MNALWPNSDVLVLPRSTVPAALSRPTASASSSGTKSAKSREPPVVVSPRVGRTVAGPVVATRALRTPVHQRRSLRAAARADRRSTSGAASPTTGRSGRASCATARAASSTRRTASTAGSGLSGAGSRTRFGSGPTATSRRSSPTRPAPSASQLCLQRVTSVAAIVAARRRGAAGAVRGIGRPGLSLESEPVAPDLVQDRHGRVGSPRGCGSALRGGPGRGAGRGRPRRARSRGDRGDGGAGGRRASAGARRPSC